METFSMCHGNLNSVQVLKIMQNYLCSNPMHSYMIPTLYAFPKPPLKNVPQKPFVMITTSKLIITI